ncbi:hypothetical protein V6N13_131489 [Hibiscus sabdariffa]|uniref:Uncharacterized protein n=1 Tax=Hibiscus sabdariffa TaxID=183260 RepID=A0ABR2D829_9ROSI
MKSTTKRYGSLLFLQDDVISEADRKKRDRAIRREKKKSKGRVSSDISGRSLTDSDMIFHNDIKMKDLSWNVRGMGSVVKLKALRRILFEQKLEIAFIQETKEEAISEEEISSMWYDVEFGSQVSLWYPPSRVREKVKEVVVIIRGLVMMKQAVDAFIEAGWVGVLETNSRVVLFWCFNPIV